MKKRTSNAEQQNIKNQLQQVLDENKHLKGELQAACSVCHSAKSELSASMWKGWSSAGVVRTGVEVTSSFSFQNAEALGEPHCHFCSFLIRLNNCLARWEKSLRNQW